MSEDAMRLYLREFEGVVLKMSQVYSLMGWWTQIID